MHLARHWTWEPGSPEQAERWSLCWHFSNFLCLVSLSGCGSSFLTFFIFFSNTLWKVASTTESSFMWHLTQLFGMQIPSPTAGYEFLPTSWLSDWLTLSQVFKTYSITFTKWCPVSLQLRGLLNLDCLPLSILLSTYLYPWALLPIIPDIFLQGHPCWCIRQFCHSWKFIVIFHTLQVENACVKTNTFSSTSYAH